MAQVDWPRQLPKASGVAVETSSIWLVEIQRPEGPNLRSLPASEATPTSIPQWKKPEPEQARLNTFGCMGTNIECELT